MELITQSFQVKLPEGWEYLFEDEIYSIFNYDSVQGVLQVSIYQSDTVFFDILEEYRKEKSKHLNATIIEMRNSSAVHYSVVLSNERLVRYDWILGKEHKKMYCTFLVNQDQEKDKFETDYQKAFDIVSNIEWV